jgi:UPF0755 protein
VINVAIPEGLARREIAPLLRRQELRGDYLAASRRARGGFRPSRYGAPSDLPSLEGFLFPATYELRPGSRMTALVSRQLDAFDEQMRRVDLTAARRRNLTAYDVLTIASMVERESAIARERRLIAAVIYNRLRQGIPLGIDATIRYATGNWKRPLRESELQIQSPYNTRTNRGLPPTPIGNPGLASIRAAADPADVDHLYYVAKVCGEGAHEFSADYDEFLRDQAAYNEARERRGGRSPTNC